MATSNRYEPAIVGGLGARASLLPEASPWPRYWARLFDLTLWGFLLTLPLGLILNSAGFDELDRTPGSLITGWLLFLLMTPVSLLIDACVTARFGISPGEYLVGIRVESRDGGALTLATLLQRNISVFVFGLALGLPLASSIAAILGYMRLSSGRQTVWDQKAQTRVVDVEASVSRIMLTIVLYLAVNALDRWVWSL